MFQKKTKEKHEVPREHNIIVFPSKRISKILPNFNGKVERMKNECCCRMSGMVHEPEEVLDLVKALDSLDPFKVVCVADLMTFDNINVDKDICTVSREPSISCETPN
ncbi:hypothetical protein KY289_026148 [Solanum tuberosum]|nr:hypothetical protein KY289_026148 [Solanum tuberosum]